MEREDIQCSQSVLYSTLFMDAAHENIVFKRINSGDLAVENQEEWYRNVKGWIREMFLSETCIKI